MTDSTPITSQSQPQPQHLPTRDTHDALLKGQSQTHYMDTATAYDLWSEVYDTDGNFLQALDTIQMRRLLPRAVSLLSESEASSQSMSQTQIKPEIKVTESKSGWKAVDLGCGTGRNTFCLLDIPSISEIVALDLSPKMLDVARRQCQARTVQALTPTAAKKIHFDVFDMITSPQPPAAALGADLILSTLVLEHVPLPTFFRTVSSLLRLGGILLLTNMHSDMGRISQAGFVDPKTGDKIRPVSYPHTVAETVAVAREYGLEVVRSGNGRVEEVGVDEWMVEKGSLGVRGRKWLGVKVWFGGVWRRVS